MIDGAVLLGYQRRWVEDKAAVKVGEKSRRIGFSYCEAADAVLHSADAERGANTYYISYAKEMTQGFIEDCATWAKAFQAAAGEIGEEVLTRDDGRDIHVYDIPFASGYHIRTFSSNPRNLRSKGRPRERLIIDEAAFVDDLDELLKSSFAMTMWGGQIHIFSTHNGDENPFNGLVQDIRAGRYDFSLHRVTLDDAIKDGLYRRICQVADRAWSAEAETEWREQLVHRYHPNEDEELFCIPAFGGGTYLPRALIAANMAEGPLLRFDGTRSFNLAPEPVRRVEIDEWIRDVLQPELGRLDKERRHVFGMDFARVGDMTDMVPLEIGAGMHKRMPFVVELHNVPYKQQAQIMLALGMGLPRFAGCSIDAGGNGGFIAEEATDKWGPMMVDSIQLSEQFYRDEFPRYKAAFEDRAITLIRHDDIMEDHRAVRLVRGIPRVPQGKTDKRGQRHGDSAIAGLLADYRSRNDAAPIEFQAAPSKADFWDPDPDGDDYDVPSAIEGGW